MTSLKSSILNIIFAVIFIFSVCQCKQPYSIIPDKTIKTSVSSNNRYKAEIKSDKTLSYYFLTIKNMERDSSVIIDTLICVKGYHEPIFNLNWNDPKSLLEITVDSDFGENVQVYNFETKTKLLVKKDKTNN